MSLKNKSSAENEFRSAFLRLKDKDPSSVTQNAVAREAGRDPSALKKDRYPILILEIQAFIKVNREKADLKQRKTGNRKRLAEEELKDCKLQRDKLASIVASQDNYIEDLLDRIDKLQHGVSKLKW